MARAARPPRGCMPVAGGGARGCSLLLLLLALGAALYLARAPLLAALGGFLIVADSPQKADAILVLSGEPTERVREAADLYREGWAPRIVFTRPEPPPGSEDLARQGVRVPTEPEVARGIAVGLGVPESDLLLVGEAVNSTASEARAFRAWAAGRGWRRVLVVTSPYHTRRVRRLFREVLARAGPEPLVIPSRYGGFRAGDWWRRRAGVRQLIIEYQKLLFYALPGRER